MDWATQVTQSKESWPEASAEQARSLGRKHWLIKQGVLAGRLAEQARSLDQGALVEQLTSKDRMGQQTSKWMLRTVPFLSKRKENLLRFTQKNRRFLVKIKRSKLVYTGDTK